MHIFKVKIHKSVELLSAFRLKSREMERGNFVKDAGNEKKRERIPYFSPSSRQIVRNNLVSIALK